MEIINLRINNKAKLILLLFALFFTFAVAYVAYDSRDLIITLKVSCSLAIYFFLVRAKFFVGTFDERGYHIAWEFVVNGEVLYKKEKLFIPWEAMAIYVFRTWPFKPYGIALNGSHFPHLLPSFHDNYPAAMRLLLEKIPHKIRNEKDRKYLESFT